MSGSKEEKPSSLENGALPRGLLGRQGMPLAPGGRLPSFKPPRDLTLGMAKSGATPVIKPRKTFTPNIPIRREKKEAEEVKRTDDQHNKRGVKKEGKGERGRGRGRGKPELIQTASSIFSEGIGSSAIKRSRAFGSRENDSEPSFIPKPKLNLKQDLKVDKVEEDMKLKHLLQDDFISDLGEGENLFPIQLPMVAAAGKVLKEEEVKEEKVLIKKEPDELDGIKIKQEKMDETEETIENIEAHLNNSFKLNNCSKGLEDVKPDIKAVEKKKKYNFRQNLDDGDDNITVRDLLQRHEGSLLFFQMPDCLPVIMPDKKEVKGESQESTSKELCTLRSLPAGCLGKLQVLKSGKTRLVVGENTWNVEMGTQVGFLQELVSVELKEQSRSGEMNVLGKVNHRVVCTPDWNSLVTSVKNERRR